MLATLEGRPADRLPVAVPCIFLLQCDHWCEITGQPAWTYYAWQIQDPAEHIKAYADFDQQLPFDILQPWTASNRERREALEIVHQDGKHYFRDRRTGEMTLLNEDLPHSQGGPNQARRAFDRQDVNRLVVTEPAHKLLESGRYDFIQAARRAFPDKFIMNGVIGTFYQCTWYVGETNLFSLLYDEPDLIHYLSQKILEKTIEDIRALAAAGDDAIYVDDALTTSDMISADFYERFSLPYVRVMIEEIRALGKKAVLIYFGGVMDRIEQIASLGADSLNVETSMKSYVNDLAEIAAQVGDRVCLWGNIDPVSVVQNGTDEDLRRAIAEQVAIGRRAGKFIVSTGSPITPLTPLPRIRCFIDLGRELGTLTP
jgi:uroporphyrinogen-III decarboxylase